VTPTEGGNGVRKSTLSTRGETPSATPQEFVDGATNLMLATLQLPRMENKAVGIKIMIARLDARLILYRLIRSGKVSARRHFQLFSDDDGANDILFSILRATKLSNKRGRRIISPVDLMHEMLSNLS
jgi:phosphatidylserine/phosphatidylglycerophosphate/cardiolipin synthase-like enzyme